MSTPLSSYARTMGFETSRDADGHLLMTMPYSIAMRGRPGFVHGGAYATLSEALGTEDKAAVKPINVTVSFMRGATEQPTFARATIERLGRRVANVEAIAWQDDPEKPVAVAQMNVMLTR